MRIFAIYGFVVNRDIVNFILWAAARLVVGSGGQNDMSDQYNVSLGVCNVKIRKSLMGAKRGSFRDASGYEL